MKNPLTRFISVLLTAVLLLPFILIPGRATEADPAPRSKSRSNPLYPDAAYEEISPEDLPGDVMAADDLVYHDTLAAAGAEICQQMKHRETVVEVGFVTRDGSDEYIDQLFDDLFNAAFVHNGVPTEGDYLQWQWGHWYADLYTTKADGYYYLYFVYIVQYYSNYQQETRMDTAVQNVLTSLNLQGKSDYQKIQAIYDYICSHVTYDFEHLYNPYYTLKYTAYAALVNGTSVCQGYALLFYRLALEAGVDSRFIGGDANGPHAWNIVRLSGSYYNLDATWDAGCDNYLYFLKSNEAFSDHVRDPQFRTDAFNATHPMSETDFDADAFHVAVPAKPYKIANVVSGIHVYWDAVKNVEKYGIWRSESGPDGPYKWIANPGTNHFTDTTVTSGKTYHYRISSINPATGEHTEKSPAISTIFVSTPDISARYNKAAGIKLEWQPVIGATGYAIYRKSYSGSDAWVRVATIPAGEGLTWTDTSVRNENGTIYRYTIRALAGTDSKILSGCRSTGRTMVRLTSRTLTAVSPASGAIQCSWNTTKSATGYEVRFMLDGKVDAQFTIGNYKTGTKTFTGLTPGRTYQVQVRTYRKVDGVGSFYSAWSEANYVTI